MKMKKGLFWTLLILLAAAVLWTAAAETAGGNEINITNYGAEPGDGQDDSRAINAALEDGRGWKVLIPEGDWDIERALVIYSDTELIADSGAVIHSSIQGGPMLHEGGDSAGGYDKAANITVTGGTWLANKEAADETQGLCFHHCRNITVRNMTIRYTSGHFVNMSGVDNGTVSGVKMTDQRQNPEKSGEEIYSSECVHLDYCTEVGEQTYGLPYDGTPSKNITVTGCTFSNVFSGAGNHREAPAGGTVSSGITVNNCTFSGLKAYAVSEIGMKGVTVTGCTATDTPLLAYLRDITGIEIRGNTVDGGNQTYPILDGKPDVSSAPISLNKCSGVTVADNTIRNLQYSAVVLFFDGTVSGESVISGNKISNVTGKGLNIRYEKAPYGQERVTVSGNELTGIGKDGITIGCLTDVQITGNTVDSAAETALYIAGTEGAPTTAAVTENILSTANPGDDIFDLRLHNYSESTVTGNTLKNYSFYHAKTAKYTADFPEMKTIIPEKETYVYTGAKICPPVTVEDAAGRVLTEGKDYTVFYSGNKQAGDPNTLVKVKGTATGMFTDQLVEQPFYIIPRAVKSPSLKAGKKQLTVKWKFDKKNDFTGYEIEYSLKKDFKNAKKISVNKTKSKKNVTEAVIENLKKGKTYYVRIRAVKAKKGNTCYSKWSKTLSVKVK